MCTLLHKTCTKTIFESGLYSEVVDVLRIQTELKTLFDILYTDMALMRPCSVVLKNSEEMKLALVACPLDLCYFLMGLCHDFVLDSRWMKGSSYHDGLGLFAVMHEVE